MKHTYCLLASLLLAATAARAQSVGIGTPTPDPKAALDIQATGKGLLIPRMDSVSRAAISTPPDGLMVFQTDGRKGFWYAIGGSWLYIPDKTKSGDNLGNHSATQNLVLNDNDLRLRAPSDGNHGLGWYGLSTSPKNWLSQNIDGPVLYGYAGGALGTNVDGTRQSVVTWTNAGNVGIGAPTPASRLSITPSAVEPKITLWDGGNTTTHYGFGVSGGQLNYHVDISNSSHVFYAGGKNGNGTELMRIKGNGRVGIGQNDPQQLLHVGGNIAADGPLGLILAAQDRPLVTRGWDAFTSGTYQGAGRWGVFMEPATLAFGIPTGGAGRSFKWLTYNTNSTVANTLMTLTQDGNLQLAGNYGYTTAQTRNYFLGVGDFVSNDPPNSQVGILYGSGPLPLGVWMSGTGQGSLLAPIKLPPGVTLTNLEITVYDGDGSTAVTTQARVVGVAGNVGSASADAPATAWVTVPHATNVVVRGSGPISMTTDANHAYMLEYQANRSGGLALLTVRVTYTTTQVN